jgi:hypothetical protein
MDGYLLTLTQLDPFQKWALICAAVLTIVYAVMRPMRKRKDPLSSSPSMALSTQREIERQMTELLVEMEKMARQMTAQLDTRATKLNLLIKEADEKLAALRTATAGIGNSTPPYSPPPPMQLSDERHQEVYDLAEQGHPPRQIARLLDRPQGEIELILALRGRNRPQAILANA